MVDEYTPTIEDLARYVLFALAARQEALLRNFQSMDFGSLTVQPLISSIESTKTAATSCLKELAARAEWPLLPLQLTFRQKAALMRDYQNLCPSAAVYQDG